MLGLFNFVASRFGVSTFLWATPLLAWVLGAGAGAWGGYVFGRSLLQTELADVHQAQAETARQQAMVYARNLQHAQSRGDALTHTLATRQNQINQLQKALHANLASLTTDRACLDADAVRVLNNTNTNTNADAVDRLVHVPTPPGSAAAAGALFATDADVGHWVIDARAQYEQCRQRLDALIDWHQQMGVSFEN